MANIEIGPVTKNTLELAHTLEKSGITVCALGIGTPGRQWTIVTAAAARARRPDGQWEPLPGEPYGYRLLEINRELHNTTEHLPSYGKTWTDAELVRYLLNIYPNLGLVS